MTILGALLHHLQPGAGQKLAHGSVRVFLALRDLRGQGLERTLAIAAERARQKLGLEQQHQPLLPIFENLGALFAAALMLGVKFIDGIGKFAGFRDPDGNRLALLDYTIEHGESSG